jgi:arabinan endo-1,5-alpha-L-arabinosidase
MVEMLKRNLIGKWFQAGLLVAELGVICPRVVAAATTGHNGTHDPSRIIESNGQFYFCGTGGGCASSTDGLAWASTGLRITMPSWSTTYAPGGNQGIWAPDIVFYGGKYYIYYAVAGLPATHAPCFIGLYTTPTLDSTAANFELTDEGMVVNNPTNTSAIQFSTIDPGPIIDPAGQLWTSWGSGYGKDTSKLQIWVTRLATTGLPLGGDPDFMPPDQLGYGLETGGIEASYVYFHDGYYYLFWNSGGCCSGASSTYTIHVARSQSITGPYGSAQTFYASNGSIHGPGHIGIYDACGAMRFTYHYYPDTGGSLLGENELSWGSDGWPVAGAPSTTPLKPCGQLGSSGTGTGGGAGSGSGTGGVGGAGGNGGGAGEGGASGAAGATGGAATTGGSGGSGEGGSSETGGQLGSGGALGAGGLVATGGVGAGGAGRGTGGAAGGTGGNASTAAGGQGGAGGTADVATAGSSNAGCGCETAGSDQTPGILTLALLGLVSKTKRRRWPA